jgi:uncharacterized protein YjbI with pentapeptide repeats
MAGLLLDRGLRTAEPNAEVWSVARARTRAMLRRLDGARKEDLLEFLAEAGLIGRDRIGIDLAEADLGEADLSGADLTGATLHGADLTGADLTGATLD